jgi:hypothetical protein
MVEEDKEEGKYTELLSSYVVSTHDIKSVYNDICVQVHQNK